MFQLFRSDLNIDFIGKAPTWLKISLGTFVAAVLVLLVKGPTVGLDFTGGHEILVEFEKPVTAQDVRGALDSLKLGETSVQAFHMATSDKTYYLARVQRSEAFGPEEIAGIEQGFKNKYGNYLKRVRYNPEAGDVIEVELTETATRAGTVDTSTLAMAGVVEATKHEVRQVRQIGRGDAPSYSIVLKGVDVSVVKVMQETLDAKARAVRVEFVGPTVGQQLRNDGLLAIMYALIAIMIYIAFRFDFYSAPGAVICLFHDSIIVIGLMSIFGEEFSMTTIAAILTLVGYSINDTIIVFDRIRETMGKAKGKGLKDVVNKSINETLSRTVLTSTTTLFASVFLMFFGRDTVLFQFGMIIFFGVIFGTYSSIYVAAPIFIWFRERFEQPEEATKGPKKNRAEAVV
ncbi:protein translocase subunit SecF [Myxococcota bacterium]|nr:protein translocase subunit SecF [Myxococcota bacterium]